MGLDREFRQWLYEYMNVKTLLQRLGLGMLVGVRAERKSPVAREREKFEEEVKEQFQKLKDKGLSIPVFTL